MKMSTSCEKSLRKVTLSLLYISVIHSVVWYLSGASSHELEHQQVHFWYMLVECLFFLIAITNINNKKSVQSNGLSGLFAAELFSCMDAVIFISFGYLLIKEQGYEGLEMLRGIFMIVSTIFKIVSELVFWSYQVELRRDHFQDIPTHRNVYHQRIRTFVSVL
ncbi:uncharacterized protein LOC135834612 isoform X4 [Planococcus citri]|uniref:uncharacterized protein LOC135834612 isoform X4 n=1 Tax=Planococcus citri TaxID=170843 RepID=UPI0031F947F2